MARRRSRMLISFKLNEILFSITIATSFITNFVHQRWLTMHSSRIIAIICSFSSHLSLNVGFFIIHRNRHKPIVRFFLFFVSIQSNVTAVKAVDSRSYRSSHSRSIHRMDTLWVLFNIVIVLVYDRLILRRGSHAANSFIIIRIIWLPLWNRLDHLIGKILGVNLAISPPPDACIDLYFIFASLWKVILIIENIIDIWRAWHLINFKCCKFIAVYCWRIWKLFIFNIIIWFFFVFFDRAFMLFVT